MIQQVQGTLIAEFSAPDSLQTDNTSASQDSLDSFHSALSDARGATVRSSIPHASANSNKLIQASVDPLSSSAVNDNTSSPLDASSNSNPLPSLPTPAPSNGAAANEAPATASAPTLDAQQAFDNTYWANQPAAVQALRTLQDPSQRATLAAQLAGEGYQIDVPIMVWGWDPSIVTSMREAEGYTWVPSALQSPVEMLPGLKTMGGLTAYNPNDPPAGSIPV